MWGSLVNCHRGRPWPSGLKATPSGCKCFCRRLEPWLYSNSSIDFDGAESVVKLDLLPCDAPVSPNKAAKELSQFTRFVILSIDTDTSQDEFAKELSRLVKLGLLPTDTRSSDEEIEFKLGFRFYVDGGPRLPWRLLIRCFWWALVIASAQHGIRPCSLCLLLDSGLLSRSPAD